MNVSGKHRIKFAQFEADLATGELFENGSRVQIQQKPFHILALLLQRAGQLVTRQELHEKLWPSTFVQKDLSLNTAMRKLRLALGETGRTRQFIETVGSRGYRFVAPVSIPESLANAQLPSRQRVRLAVLPFENLGKEDSEYFSDGLTEQLIALMGRAHRGVSVIAPVSSMQYKRTSKPTAQIGHELRADYILGGSVLLDGARVRVTAKLIRCADQTVVWSDSFSRDERDIFLIQEGITRQISRSMLKAIPGLTEGNASAHTTSSGTYQKFLKACYFGHKWTEPAFRRAIDYFEQVIAEDPGYVPALGCYAYMYAAMAQYGGMDPNATYELVRSYASRAVEIDPDYDYALVSLAQYHIFHSLEWRAAEAILQRTLTINPSFALAYTTYGQLLTLMQRSSESVAMVRRAADLDPASPVSRALVACAEYFAGQYAEAQLNVSEALEMDPNFPTSLTVLGWISEAEGQIGAASAAYERAAGLAPQSGLMLAHHARGLALAGRKDEASKVLDSVLALRRQAYVPSYAISLAYLAIGNREEAFRWLMAAFDEKCPWRVFCGVDPKFRPLYGDPRFESLRKCLELP